MWRDAKLVFIICCSFVVLMLGNTSSKANAATITGFEGKCLDIRDGGSRDGAEVQIYTCHGGPNQDWVLNQAGEIRGYGGKCLDIRGGETLDGTPVQIHSCNSGPNQQWRFTGTPFTTRGEIRGHGDKCLDIRGGTSVDGAPVQIFTCHGGPNQQWAFVTPPPGHVSETMVDRCSADVIISRVYRDEDEPASFDPRQINGMYLKRGAEPYTEWSGRMPVNGHTYIRWWCHSTTGNWADIGTWRIRSGEIGIGCTGDWDQGQVEECHQTASIDIAVDASSRQGWTPERSRCTSDRTRAISARLGPDRLLEIRCLE